ncbi:MAG: hypothetical protein ACRD2M_04235, partial [Terriglobales bacterium]
RDARGAIEFNLLSGGTLVPTRVRIENLDISTRNGSAPNTTPGDVCIKFRASYSILRNIACSIDGDGATDPPASGILFLGDQTNGNGSYYNLFDTITVGGRASVTGVTDEVCFRFDTDTAAGTRFPNANVILGGGQMVSCSTGVWVRGSGNSFYGVVTQSNTTQHWRFGVTGSLDTNEGNIFGAYVEGGAASTAFQFETSAKNNRVLPSVITGVTNRFVDNATNGRNLLYELSHSGVSSGSPQYGWGFDSASSQSRYYNNEVVSHAFGAGSFIVGGGNGIHFAATATTASSANCSLTGGAGFFQAHRGAGGDCAVRKYFNRTSDTDYQNRLNITGAVGNISLLAESAGASADANIDFTFTPKGTGKNRFSAHLFAVTDNTIDIGASGASRPRTGYFATSVITPAITVGASGTSITQVRVYSQSLNVASVGANTTSEQTFTVTGLATADKCFVNKPSHTTGLGVVNCRVSASDTLAVTFMNNTGAAIDPAAEAYAIVTFRN